MPKTRLTQGLPILKKLRQTLEATRAALLEQVEKDQREIRQLQQQGKRGDKRG